MRKPERTTPDAWPDAPSGMEDAAASEREADEPCPAAGDVIFDMLAMVAVFLAMALAVDVLSSVFGL